MPALAGVVSASTREIPYVPRPATRTQSATDFRGIASCDSIVTLRSSPSHVLVARWPREESNLRTQIRSPTDVLR